MSDKNRNKPPPVLGPDVRKVLGRALQAVYADIIAEGVPERFVAILRRLDEPSDEGSTFAFGPDLPSPL
jgi:Anti-sigma factor NepR